MHVWLIHTMRLNRWIGHFTQVYWVMKEQRASKHQWLIHTIRFKPLNLAYHASVPSDERAFTHLWLSFTMPLSSCRCREPSVTIEKRMTSPNGRFYSHDQAHVILKSRVSLLVGLSVWWSMVLLFFGQRPSQGWWFITPYRSCLLLASRSFLVLLPRSKCDLLYQCPCPPANILRSRVSGPPPYKTF